MAIGLSLGCYLVFGKLLGVYLPPGHIITIYFLAHDHGPMDAFVNAFPLVFDPSVLGAVGLGTVIGLIFGAIPGLTYTMALSLVLPLTFGAATMPAIALMVGTYVGGMTGGSVSAILIGVPGTPSAAATVLDGYPMRQDRQGEPGARPRGDQLDRRRPDQPVHHGGVGQPGVAAGAQVRAGGDFRAGRVRHVDHLRAGGKVAGARADRRRARPDDDDHRPRRNHRRPAPDLRHRHLSAGRQSGGGDDRPVRRAAHHPDLRDLPRRPAEAGRSAGRPARIAVVRADAAHLRPDDALFADRHGDRRHSRRRRADRRLPRL